MPKQSFRFLKASSFFLILLKSNSAAVFPISNAGCVIVVRGGLSIGAVSIVENTTTFNSPGILTPISLQTKYAAIASRSTEATIPSGGFLDVSSFLIWE